MRSLVSSLREAEGIGEPLPPIWQKFVENGVEFRRGMLCLIAAAPGVGKSILAVNLALDSQVPSLYVSCDTDAYTTAVRVVAKITGCTINQAEKNLGNADIRKKLQGVEHIRWSFNASTDIDDIVQEVKAFDVMWGSPPELLIVDNLSNMFNEEPNPYLAHRHNMESLNILARETGACVVVLHHLTGQYESGTEPPPQAALEGKVAKLPGLVLGLFRGQYNDLGVTICKNRFGPSDPGGRLRMYLTSDMERVRIG